MADVEPRDAGRSMGAVLWHVIMSLDGFIAGPDDAMEGALEQGAASALADVVMAATGVILAGRRWYDIATRRYGGRRGVYGGPGRRARVRADAPAAGGSC
jgi:hypothetical protein